MSTIEFAAVGTGQISAAKCAVGVGAESVNEDTNLVPDPVNQLFLGDAAERIAALLIKSFREDRRMSKDMERLQEQIIMKEAKARVQEMREQAKEIGKSAWRSGLGQMASGGLTIGSAFSPSKPEREPGLKAAGADQATTDGAKKAATDAKKAATEGAEKAAAESAEKAAANGAENANDIDYSAALGGSAKICEGTGRWASGACDEAAKDHEASATEHDAAKEAATRRADVVRDETKDIEAMLDRVVEFLEKVWDGQQKANQAAIMRA